VIFILILVFYFKKEEQLDIFALIVLTVIVVSILALAVFIGYMPGKIAADRKHPQAEAINVCGWFGVLTMGILLPVAYIWAYTNVDKGGKK